MSLFGPLATKPQASFVLEGGADVLDELGVKWWLSAGTMLGLYRDGGFIPHDTDIDVGVLGEPSKEMDEAFKSAGYLELRFMPFQRAFQKDNVVFDIYFFQQLNDTLICDCDIGRLIKPASLFDTLGTIEFLGREYPTPNPVETYLEVRYGKDWKIPKTKKDTWEQDAANLHKQVQ